MARLNQRKTRVQAMNRTEVCLLYDKWESQIDSVRNEQEQFLRDSGWNYTCSNPGSMWFWVKDGLRVSMETALDIEVHSRSPAENDGDDS